MTTGTGDSAAEDAESFARDWEALRADGDIQFAPVKLPEPQAPPEWLEALSRFLGKLLRPLGEAIASLARSIGISGQTMTWLLVGVGVSLAALVLWRYLGHVRWRRGAATEAAPEWTPDSRDALALLEDADRLAAEGRYDEATHLLLQRSVGQIAAARPDLIEPSSTAREIAALPALSQAARGAFGVIAERVERSLFALRKLTADDWRAARAAYADFALAVPA